MKYSDRRSLVTNEVYDDENNLDSIVTIRVAENEDKFMKFLDDLNENTKRVLGIALATFSGVLYAFTFTPALYVQDNYSDGNIINYCN